MPRSVEPFRFRQFSVAHDRSSMRVNTDAVLLGAWCPVPDGCAHILDVGTGSGVIALMLAQRCEGAEVTAIDIDGPSVSQAQDNFLSSPWVERLSAKEISLQEFASRLTRNPRSPREPREQRYYVALALAILLGAASGLYDKYLMRRYDHNAVQVYYTFYQAVMMAMVWAVLHRRNWRLKIEDFRYNSSFLPIALISIFLIISDNVYMLALRDPDSLIAVVSTIRRGGAVIGFAYGLLFLKEENPLPKVLCMIGIGAGLLCLAFGA